MKAEVKVSLSELKVGRMEQREEEGGGWM